MVGRIAMQGAVFSCSNPRRPIPSLTSPLHNDSYNLLAKVVALIYGTKRDREMLLESPICVPAPGGT